MAEDGGLFGGLKFTDLFLPAAGAVASAYNPYIGYGLQTGMNMFNTLAGFQDALQRQKLLREQWNMEKQAIEDVKESAGMYVGGLEEQQQRMKKRFTEMAQDEVDNLGIHGAGGPAFASAPEPLSAEDQKQAFDRAALPETPRFSVFGAQTLPQDLQQFDMGLPPLSEALPWRVDERVAQMSAADPDYQALQERIAATQMAARMSAASPGQAAATLGNIGLRGYDAAAERARFDEANRAAQASREQDFLNSQVLKDQELQSQLKLISEREESQKRQYDAYFQGQRDAADARAAAYSGMAYDDLLKEWRLVNQALTEARKWAAPGDVGAQAQIEGLQRQSDNLARAMAEAAARQPQKAETPEELAAAAERAKGYTGGGTGDAAQDYINSLLNPT